MNTRFQLTNTSHRFSTAAIAISPPLSGLLLCLSLALGASTAAQAASFDCAKASSDVEHTICNNPKLSDLDDSLNDNYQLAMANLPGEQAEALRSTQRSWLKQRDACQGQERCLSDLFSQRAAQLQDTANERSAPAGRARQRCCLNRL